MLRQPIARRGVAEVAGWTLDWKIRVRFPAYPHRVWALWSGMKIGDEFHYLFECSHNDIFHARLKFIPKKYYQRPNIIKFQQLFTCTNPVQLKKISKFLIIVKKLLENINRWKLCFSFVLRYGSIYVICDYLIYFLCDNSLLVYIILLWHYHNMLITVRIIIIQPPLYNV